MKPEPIARSGPDKSTNKSILKLKDGFKPEEH
jgi:hypothetical protein